MRTLLAINVLVLMAAAGAPRAQTPAGDVARGEYIMKRVAMCVQCHSPRDQHGQILEDRLFTGAPIPVNRPPWSPRWASRAPNIAGLPGFTDEQVVMLLTEGHAGNREPPSPPMPPFRMAPDDARAVVAFLRSLK